LNPFWTVEVEEGGKEVEQEEEAKAKQKTAHIESISDKRDPVYGADGHSTFSNPLKIIQDIKDLDLKQKNYFLRTD